MSKSIGVRIEERDNVVVFWIEGHFDASIVNAVSERVHDVLKSECSNVIFDFSNLSYISSSGLRVLLYAAKKIRAKGGAVCLSSVHSSVQRIIDVTGLAQLLPSYKNLDESIKIFQ